MTREVTTSDGGNESLLLARAAAFPEHPELASLMTGTLRHVSSRHGVDFATALLYDRLKRCPPAISVARGNGCCKPRWSHLIGTAAPTRTSSAGKRCDA